MIHDRFILSRILYSFLQIIVWFLILLHKPRLFNLTFKLNEFAWFGLKMKLLFKYYSNCCLLSSFRIKVVQSLKYYPDLIKIFHDLLMLRSSYRQFTPSFCSFYYRRYGHSFQCGSSIFYLRCVSVLTSFLIFFN